MHLIFASNCFNSTPKSTSSRRFLNYYGNRTDLVVQGTALFILFYFGKQAMSEATRRPMGCWFGLVDPKKLRVTLHFGWIESKRWRWIASNTGPAHQLAEKQGALAQAWESSWAALKKKCVSFLHTHTLAHTSSLNSNTKASSVQIWWLGLPDLWLNSLQTRGPLPFTHWTTAPTHACLVHPLVHLVSQICQVEWTVSVTGTVWSCIN